MSAPNPNDRSPSNMRGWCEHCHDLTVRQETGKCEKCGGKLDRRHEYVETGY